MQAKSIYNRDLHSANSWWRNSSDRGGPSAPHSALCLHLEDTLVTQSQVAVSSPDC